MTGRTFTPLARFSAPLAAVILALLLLSGCTDSAPQQFAETVVKRSTQENILRKSNGAEPQTLDPHKAEGVPAGNILRDLYEGLTIEAPNGDVIPGVAESWILAEDGITYTFKLRKDARWSNSDSLTAEDFVYSFRRAVNPATLSRMAGMLYPIRNAEKISNGELEPDTLGVTALSSDVLQIVLEAPTPYFLSVLNHSMAYPVYRDSVEEHGDQFTRPGNAITNGAYKIKDWVVQSHVALERNEQYWDNANTRIDGVEYHAIENPDTVVKRYRAGELDMTQEAPYRQIGWILENVPDEYHVAPYLGAYYYGFNVLQVPFKDQPKLRRALALAVDRDIITQKLTRSGEVPAYSWVPPVLGYEQQLPEWADWTQEERNAEAKRLFAEAGFGKDNPLTVEILYNTQQNHKQLAIAIGSMWKETLGVNTTLRNQEWKVFLQTRFDKIDTQIFRSGWIGDYNDAYTFLQLMETGNGQNDSGYSNPEVDALLKQARGETDLEQRAELMQAAERLILQDMPFVPIYFYVSKHLIKPYVQGFVPNIMDHVYTKDLWLESV